MRLAALVPGFVAVVAASGSIVARAPAVFPADGATNVNPDTHLVLTFDAAPRIGTRGLVRIRDAATGDVVDTLDLSVPTGPSRPSVAAAPGTATQPAPVYQHDVIGGFTEGFHFFPVIVRGAVATIYPHHGALAYGRSYRVEIDPGAVAVDGTDAPGDAWTFSTKAAPPDWSGDRAVVAADGSGDFSTVQGAIDAVPDHHPRRVTIAIRAGTYEEIVYFRHKSDVTFLGDDRARVVIGYANNEFFNGPPAGVATNEKPGTFPYRRAAFMADASSGIEIRQLTIENLTPQGGGQAEALILAGGRNLVADVDLRSHQDTVQFNDAVFVENATIEGDTDFLWGRGPAFFEGCTLREWSAGPFMWVRSTAATHGFVFHRCRFETPNVSAGGPRPFLARDTAAYPGSEVVLLDCLVGLIDPSAWMLPDGAAPMRYWEFDSTDIGGGASDVSRRNPASRALVLPADSVTIANYGDPAYVLDGWRPQP